MNNLSRRKQSPARTSTGNRNAKWPSVFLAAFILGVLVTKASAEVLTVSVGMDNRPFAMPEGHEGITLEILKSTLGPAGYEFDPYYVPYERRFLEYKANKLDVVVDARPESVAQYNLPGFISDPAVRYDNEAFFLKKRGLTITGAGDLKPFSVISWQGARHVMGEEYATMVRNNSNYYETSNQRSQVMMLFLGRVDIVHMDRTIFSYWRNQVGKSTSIDVWQDVDTYHFGELSFSYLFANEKIRDLFNKRFGEVKESGEYARIYEKYTVLDKPKR